MLPQKYSALAGWLLPCSFANQTPFDRDAWPSWALAAGSLQNFYQRLRTIQSFTDPDAGIAADAAACKSEPIRSHPLLMFDSLLVGSVGRPSFKDKRSARYELRIRVNAFRLTARRSRHPIDAKMGAAEPGIWSSHPQDICQPRHLVRGQSVGGCQRSNCRNRNRRRGARRTPCG